MKKSEIKVGGHYIAKISGNLTTVRVDNIYERCLPGYGTTNLATRYDVTNLKTGRRTTFRSAAKFRRPVDRYQGLKDGTIKPTSLTDECITAGSEWAPNFDSRGGSGVEGPQDDREQEVIS